METFWLHRHLETCWRKKVNFLKEKHGFFTFLNMSVDPYGPASQTLTFLDTDEADFGADTQGSAYEFTDFTAPSQTQTQSQASQPAAESQQNVTPEKEESVKEKLTNGEEESEPKDVGNVTKSLGELNFEEEDDETYYSKDLPSHACR